MMDNQENGLPQADETAAAGILGIVAGQGGEPRRLVEACLGRGRPFFLIAFEGQTAPEVVDGVPHAWVRLGAGGKTLKILKKQQISEVVLAGWFERPSLADLRPDLWTVAFLARNGRKVLDDEAGLVAAVVRDLELREGIRVVALNDVLSEA